MAHISDPYERTGRIHESNKRSAALNGIRFSLAILFKAYFALLALVVSSSIEDLRDPAALIFSQGN